MTSRPSLDSKLFLQKLQNVIIAPSHFSTHGHDVTPRLRVSAILPPVVPVLKNLYQSSPLFSWRLKCLVVCLLS